MATATGKIFASALTQAYAGNIKTSDTWKVALLSSSYTPNLTSQIHWSDVSTDEVTGTGYTAGGASVSTPSITATAAGSWSVTWAASTAYTVGQVVRPSTSNGYVYECVAAGTSGASAPTFPTTFGETVSDGTVTWVNAGEAVVAISAGTASWSASTITASYAVLYDAASGTASTEPLIAVITFPSSQSSSNGTFSVVPDTNLGYASFTLA